MNTSLDLPRCAIELCPPRPLHALALSGGGFRGLYTATILSELETQLGQGCIGDCFDLFSGTSVGGIIAAGLATGISARRIQEGFITLGHRIFDPWMRFKRVPFFRKLPGPAGGLFMSKFKQAALRDAIVEIIGEAQSRAAIAEIAKPLILVATCATTKRPVLISNYPIESSPTRHYLLIDALLASAAAPGFFNAVEVENRSLVDGGLVANAPELVALTHILRCRLAPISNCRMLSIGTAAPDQAATPKQQRFNGLLRWSAGELIPLVLEAQERTIVDQVAVLMGDNYYRINSIPAPRQAAFLSLDTAGQKSIDTMVLLAKQAVHELPLRVTQKFINTDHANMRFDVPSVKPT